MPNPKLSSFILPVKDQSTGKVTNVEYDLPAGGGSITVDDEISSTSENPVQNKVISAALDEKADTSALGTAASKNVASSGDASTSQVVMGNDTRLSDARPASDVSSWAKASTKPSYTASEVGLGNVGNFKAVSTAANQGLSDEEKANARTNIGAGSGTVTSVATGAGLTGGSITGSGTIKADLKSETKSSLTATSKGSTSSREYAVGLDSAGDLSVNIPWTDTRDFKLGTSRSGATNNTLYFVYS